jgi:hypothetical protein
MSTNTTPLAVKEVGYEITLFVLIYTTLGAKYLAHTTFDTSAEIISRPLGTPIAGLILAGVTGFGDNPTDFQFLPCQLIF